MKTENSDTEEIRFEGYALIGAGPAGLTGARNLSRLGIPFQGFEGHSDVGGLWDISNPVSTVYESAHLISSKKKTELLEFPMKAEVPDYPDHNHIRRYFQDYAAKFDLYKHYRFNVRVTEVLPVNDGQQWKVRLDTGEVFIFDGVIIANGMLSEPRIPEYPGSFKGRIMHSAEYKEASIFDGKEVLIVGGGNSGCDIAVDAIHRARSVSMSLRRGYHFVPKYVFGKPADTIGGAIKLPAKIKQKVDSIILKWFTGDPRRVGFPEPDHKLYESHPIVNSLVIYHAGHGDLDIRPDIKEYIGDEVIFTDHSRKRYDIIVLATGYHLHFPFLDRKYLAWENSMAPQFYLNAFHPEYDNLFILGMIEATGLGWQGRYDQAELVALFIDALRKEKSGAKKIIDKKKRPVDMRGGMKYMNVDRMAYYVHKDTYIKELKKHKKLLL